MHSKINSFLLISLTAILLSSCSLLGIHFKVHNPVRAGKYPKETRQIILQAQDSKYRNCYDVIHNAIYVEVNPQNQSISGKVVITGKALNKFDSLQIDLFKNLKVDSIEALGKVLPYKREENAIFIQMPKTMNKDENFSITITYEGKPAIAKRPPWSGGFIWKKDKNGNPWIGVACESEGSSLWWPSKDVMYDEAESTDISITVPHGLMAVSNGILKDSIIKADKSTYHWHVSYPINNYNVTLYIGNLIHLADNYQSNTTGLTLELNHYVLPYNYELASVHFKQLKNHLAFYEKMFGPYPWQRDGFKLVESPYAGMEHQSAIAYGNGYKNDVDGRFDYIILHETAHEWWGNSVTAADLSDAWIHEGFASYCEALYVENLKGHKEYLNYMYNQKIYIENKRPVVRKRGIRYFDYHDEDIYVKGSWVLHTLRGVLANDTLFFDILKSFRINNNQKQILSEAFIDLVNEKTGNDYSWFFKQYLFNRKSPILETYWHNELLYFRWKNTDTDFKMKVDIELPDKILSISPTTEVQAIKLPVNLKTINFNLDELLYGLEDNKYLEWDFYNKKNTK